MGDLNRVSPVCMKHNEVDLRTEQVGGSDPYMKTISPSCLCRPETLSREVYPEQCEDTLPWRSCHGDE